MSNATTPRRVLFAAATALVVSGCFSYIPTDLDTVPVGENVRLYVTRQVVDDLQEVTPLGEPIVRGVLVRRQGDGLFLRVPIAVRQEGFHSSQIGQEVLIANREIIQVERRQFDRLGTSALVAGTIGAASVVVFVIMSALSSDADEFGCEDDCGELLAPVLRLRIR